MGSLRSWRVLLITILSLVIVSPVSAEAAPRQQRHAPRQVVKHHHTIKHATAAKTRYHAHHSAAPAKKPLGKWKRKSK